jgi:hypothetical protein
VSASESPLPTSRALSVTDCVQSALLCALLHGLRESAQLSCSLLEQIIGSRQACSEAAGSGVPVAPWVKIDKKGPDVVKLSVKYKDNPNWWTHSLLREGYGKDKYWVLLGLPGRDAA